MRDLIWIAALALALAGVWFFMVRLDRLLKASSEAQEPEERGLRLGVERGLDRELLREAFPEARLFHGTAEELRRGLAEGRLDAVLLRSGEACGAVLLWRDAARCGIMEAPKRR